MVPLPGLYGPSAELPLPKLSFLPLEVIVLPPVNGHFALQSGRSATQRAVAMKRAVEASHLAALFEGRFYKLT